MLFVTVLIFMAQTTVHLFLFISIETFELFSISSRKSNKKFCVVDSVCLFSTFSLRFINFKISGTISFISFSERFVALSFSSKSVLIVLLSIVLPIWYIDLSKIFKTIISENAKKVKKNRTFFVFLPKILLND